MEKYQEVEVKYPLLNMHDVVSALQRHGAIKTLDCQHQLDIYFTPKHKNFLDKEYVTEWLRLRKTENNNTINYKRWLPEDEIVKTHCDEYEITINDIHAMELMLNSLEFREIIRVDKTRESWTIQEVEVSIDSVVGLGCFIELEAIEKVEEESISKILAQFDSLINLLGASIGTQDRRGYPYLLIELSKGENK